MKKYNAKILFLSLPAARQPQALYVRLQLVDILISENYTSNCFMTIEKELQSYYDITGSQAY